MKGEPMKVFKDDSPIYLQLRAYIEEAILTQALKENESLPSLRVMAKEYNLNPITISNAINMLEDEGILFKKRGIGIFVQENARSIIISKKGSEFLKEELALGIKKAKLLEIPKKNVVNLVNEIYGE
jgi:DNA-binding transcriptional regulator YhcF (GntR family)